MTCGSRAAASRPAKRARRCGRSRPARRGAAVGSPASRARWCSAWTSASRPFAVAADHQNVCGSHPRAERLRQVRHESTAIIDGALDKELHLECGLLRTGELYEEIMRRDRLASDI